MYRLISQQSEKLLYIGGDNGHQRFDPAQKPVALVAAKNANVTMMNGRVNRVNWERLRGCRRGDVPSVRPLPPWR